MYYHPGFPRNRKSREITLHMKIYKLSQKLSLENESFLFSLHFFNFIV